MSFSSANRLPLDWWLENRTVPLEVTNALQAIADQYQYSADLMHQHKELVLEELCQSGKGYIAVFLFPNGSADNDRWLHALIRMEVRRLQQIMNTKEKR
jgi:hypothetical protein